MELVIVFIIIFVIYGAGWIWQTVSDIVRDINRANWDNRVYGQVTSAQSLKKTLGGHDLSLLRRTYARFSDERDGQMHDRVPFESPKVSYTFKNSRALLSIYESTEESARFYTQLTFAIPSGLRYRAEIFPQRARDTDVKYLNIDDIRIGDDVFDPRYVVKSNDAGWVKEFLDLPVRGAIDELRDLIGTDQVLVSLNSSRLMIRKQGILGTTPDLDTFGRLSERIFDRVLIFWQRASGIEIMDEAEGTAHEDPTCQVCGSKIPGEQRVYCKRCKTPHHSECWNFNQGCSTYACGEKRFTQKY